ncbi:uncharacterized protein [Argopecten irradians]|uniref:uncharacterized protein n=1 Tax=Argopecten irradians TaxID=31199 RepID=UPI00371A94D9
MSSVKDLIDIGKDMGLEGAELLAFVKDEQARERDERQREREAKNKEAERQFQLERMKQEEKHEQEKIKLEMDLETQREERSIREHNRKIELLQEEAKLGVKSSMVDKDVPGGGARCPKLTPFDEDKDNMDSYLRRFERYATTQRWDKVHWATNLSVLLKGRALDVFSRLPVDQSLDYDALKAALLKRFEMTEEGFRKRFRTGRPETGETFSQFGVRMESYLMRWLEMSGTGLTFDEFKDFVVRDQVLQTCGHDLALFLKERAPRTLAEMTKLADQYAEARGNPSNLVKPKFTSSKQGNGGSRTQTTDGKSSEKKDVKAAGINGRHCYICKKTDHLANRCPKRDSHKVGTVDSETSEPKSKGKSTSQKSCSFISSSEDESEDLNMPVSCGTSAVKMPVVMGYVGNQHVSVLRDSGCGKAVVRKSLVSPEEMTGKMETCKLADGTVLHLPTASIRVDTPYYTGQVEAWVMETPIYDLMLGNMDNVRPAEEPDSKWTRSPEVNAVQTRAQARQQTTYRPLKVPKDLGDIDPHKFQDAQQTDESLANIRKFVQSGEVKERQDGSSSSFALRQGLIYREYKGSSKMQERRIKQLVVPAQYRNFVLRLAHDSVMAGHLGAKRTADRILLEFYWPGVIADVSRYCRSCDVCQRTFPKGRVTKVPLGRMPLIDVPFQRVAIDLVGPLQPATDRGNRYILTLVDYATRYPEAVALRGIEAERSGSTKGGLD